MRKRLKTIPLRRMANLSQKVQEYENLLKEVQNEVTGSAAQRIKELFQNVNALPPFKIWSATIR